MSEDFSMDFSADSGDNVMPPEDSGTPSSVDGQENQGVNVDAATTAASTPSANEPFVFEDLTLAQALGLLLFRPIRVGRELWRVTISNQPERFDKPATSLNGSGVPADAPMLPPAEEAEPDATPTTESVNRPAASRMLSADLAATAEENWLVNLGRFLQIRREEVGLTVLLGVAMVFAFFGATGLREAALDPVMRAEGDTGGSLFWLGLAGVMGLSYMGYRWWKSSREVAPQAADTIEQPPLLTEEDFAPTLAPVTLSRSPLRRVFGWVERYAPSLSLLPLALLMSYLAFSRNVATNPEGEVTGVIFTTFGFVMWVGAMASWFVIFTVDFNQLYMRAARREWPRWNWPQVQFRWVHILLLVVVLVGGYFRLHRLEDVPPDMTSDHIEKLIDAVKVDNGIYAVFFENNGGREAFQMYTVAVIADWFDVGFNFNALKYATVIEGMLAIILSYWVTKELVGRQTPDRDRLGTWVGLGTAILMAMSSWHVMLSRLGLRIVLTPLTVLLVSFFLVRGVRYNRRVDFALLGLILGLGTYFYQANRMLPILVVAAVVLAIVFNSRLRFSVMWRYGFNLAVAGIIAIAAYLPMYRYSEEFPQEFWRRSYGRIFGEQYFSCVGEDGRADFCRPSIAEMIDAMALERYGPDGDLTGWQAFAHNYEDALITYVYEGDGQWITNANGYPALDARTAGLYVLGAVLWLVLMVRYRDVGLAIAPVGIIVLILPSALAIAPGLDENPSYTRLSGTAPFVFMLAALPLGLLMSQAMRIGRHAAAYGAVTIGLISLLLINIGERNYDVYFEDYRAGYELSWRPYSDIASPLQEFANNNGSFGNAFYVHYEHWLDHRILGSVAGDLTWPNGLLEAEDVFAFMLSNQDTPYAYNPQQPLLFYVHTQDTEDIEWLQRTFPDGRLREVTVPGDTDFLVYEAPPGLNWMSVTLGAQTSGLGCNLNCLPGPR